MAKTGPNGNGPHGLKLTDELAAKICQAIRTGATLEGSAAYAGVARQTFFDWLRRGRQANARNPYKTFVADVEEALAGFEVGAMTRIAKAGDEEWQANAWRLERRFPDKYGRRTRLDGNIQVQAAPFVDLAKLTLDEQVELRRLLAKGQPEQEQLAAGQAPALELLPGGETSA